MHPGNEKVYFENKRLVDMPACVKARMMASMVILKDKRTDVMHISGRAVAAASLFINEMLQQLTRGPHEGKTIFFCSK